ncbi:MAG: TetR/AcrR family transcriptional regulator [Pseudomonadota bacterium]
MNDSTGTTMAETRAPRATDPAVGGSLRQRKKQQARDSILAAAQQLIESSGYNRTKMRDIAQAAGVSYQTLYNYFPTKAQILQNLLADKVQGVREQAQEIGAACADAPGTIPQLAELYLDTITEPDRALWGEVGANLFASTADEANSLLALIDADALDRFQALAELGKSQGVLQADADTQTLATVIGALVEMTLLRFVAQNGTPREQFAGELQRELQFLLRPHLVA